MLKVTSVLGICKRLLVSNMNLVDLLRRFNLFAFGFVNYKKWLSLYFLIFLVVNNVYAFDSCKGKRVFSCASLSKTVATKKRCYLYYQCRELQNGEACFQCKQSINKLTKGLCDEDNNSICLKKDI